MPSVTLQLIGSAVDAFMVGEIDEMTAWSIIDVAYLARVGVRERPVVELATVPPRMAAEIPGQLKINVDPSENIDETGAKPSDSPGSVTLPDGTEVQAAPKPKRVRKNAPGKARLAKAEVRAFQRYARQNKVSGTVDRGWADAGSVARWRAAGSPGA